MTAEGRELSALVAAGAGEIERAALLLNAIIESSDDAIISKDLDGIITSWNKGAERMFGYTAAETVGQSITILIPLDRLDEEPKILARLRRGERVDHFRALAINVGCRADKRASTSNHSRFTPSAARRYIRSHIGQYRNVWSAAELQAKNRERQVGLR